MLMSKHRTRLRRHIAHDGRNNATLHSRGEVALTRMSFEGSLFTEPGFSTSPLAAFQPTLKRKKLAVDEDLARVSTPEKARCAASEQTVSNLSKTTFESSKILSCCA